MRIKPTIDTVRHIEHISLIKMAMSGNDVTIPFGKYKGQSKEVILKDISYVEWVLEQPSLSASYPDFMTWLKQHYDQSKETNKSKSLIDHPTPQHNAAQNLFTSRDFTRRFLRFLTGYDPDQGLAYWWQQIDYVTKEHPNLSINQEKTQISINGFTVRVCDWFNHLRLEGNVEEHDVCIDTPRLIQNGVIKISLGWSVKVDGDHSEGILVNKYFGMMEIHKIICPPIYVEIKPLLGDDYPRVLAKMQKKGQNVLYVQIYQSNTTPLDTMKKIFKRSGIRVITQEDLIQNVTKKNEPITPPPSVKDGTRIRVIDKVTKVDMLGVPVHVYNAFKHFVDVNGLVLNYDIISASPAHRPIPRLTQTSVNEDGEIFVALPTTPTKSVPTISREEVGLSHRNNHSDPRIPLLDDIIQTTGDSEIDTSGKDPKLSTSPPTKDESIRSGIIKNTHRRKGPIPSSFKGHANNTAPDPTK